MPWYLRIGFRADRWLTLPWLPAGEVQADAVRDFNRIKNNTMSVFLVNSDAESIRAAIAIACKEAQDKAFGYALFDVEATQALGVRIVTNGGDTPDTEVNTWHHELQELTFAHLSEVAKLIKQGGVEDIPLPAFKERLQRAVKAGEIERHQVHQKNLE